MLPLLVGSVGALYSAGKAYDTWKYYNEYRKNTGFSPRYKFRSGEYSFALDGVSIGYAFGRGLKRF